MIGKVYRIILNGTVGNVKLNHLGEEVFLSADVSKNKNPDFLTGHSDKWYELHEFIYGNLLCAESCAAYVRYFNLIQGVNIGTENYVLDYRLYREALKEIRKSGYVLSENDLNDTEKAIKSRREIFEMVQKILSKVHGVVEAEKVPAQKIAEDVINFFDNIDFGKDELEAEDIRRMIKEIRDFYGKCLEAGINIPMTNNINFRELENSAQKIAEAIAILQKDYSCEDDIAVLYAFSSNPARIVKPFLDVLEEAGRNVETARGQMESEKKALTLNGNWDSSVDPRFTEQQEYFETLLAKLNEVQANETI